MSPEVPGLRKRLASFKPPNVSPVSEMRVKHEEDGGVGAEHEYDGKIAEEAFSENLSHSFSSMSSRSSRSTVNEDSDHGGDGPDALQGDAQANGSTACPDELTSQYLSKKTFAKTSRSDLPQVSPNVTRPSLRVPQSSSRDIKYTRNNASSPSSWLGLDFSIIIALVSPIGNLLTGSDHIKNILLLLLLIYYLHQLVEGALTFA